MKRTRIALLAAISAVALSAPVAMAGTDGPLVGVAPQVTDPKGDSLGDDGSDIISAGLTSTGAITTTVTTTYTTQTQTLYKTVKVIKKVKVKGKTKKKVTYKKVAYTQSVKVAHKSFAQTYAPDTLVINLTMAGAPDTGPGSYSDVTFTTPKCGEITVSYSYAATADPGYALLGNCDPASADPTATSNSFGFTPKINGNTIEFDLPLDKLAATDIATATMTKIGAHSGTADPVVGAALVSDAYDDASGTASFSLVG